MVSVVRILLHGPPWVRRELAAGSPDRRLDLVVVPAQRLLELAEGLLRLAPLRKLRWIVSPMPKSSTSAVANRSTLAFQ